MKNNFERFIEAHGLEATHQAKRQYILDRVKWLIEEELPLDTGILPSTVNQIATEYFDD